LGVKVAGKQKAYLDELLGNDAGSGVNAKDAPSPSLAALGSRPNADKLLGTTLLGRESALARVASGEVRQVTQLLLDPKRVRIWGGNARQYERLSEDSCRELIDSVIAEGGQKVPAVVRRVSDDPEHDYEVIAGTRRHFAISWLRSHNYPDFAFVAQVAALDDEAAFRLADLENRARSDISDLERAQNYAVALQDHYEGHLTRMAERLRVSKGWLSKMVKVASLPESVLGAFASHHDVQLKPAYALAQAFGDRVRQRAVLKSAKEIATEQLQRRNNGASPIGASEVFRRLLNASAPSSSATQDPFIYVGKHGRPALSVQSANRQGVTIRLHAGSGADADELANALKIALEHLESIGSRLRP
jgi:ParB family chromosome partitioning protein